MFRMLICTACSLLSAPQTHGSAGTPARRKATDEEVCAPACRIVHVLSMPRIRKGDDEIDHLMGSEVLREIPFVQALGKLHVKLLNDLHLGTKDVHRSKQLGCSANHLGAAAK